jgi:holo-[acyl-carrier protein] synthase
MIIGMGSDIVDIRRIERTLERYGERFVQRIFTPTEQRKSERRRARAASYAKRFAAKEACATGLRRGVFWRDMGVVNLPSGKPTIELTGGALRQLHRLLPDGHAVVVHLTITDEFPTAQAFVIIEALAPGPHP